MVNVDTVYQKVLAMANKEQRGYITPQEFNLFADKAQMEIFEHYFHDLKTAQHKRKNETSYSDEVDIILEKLQVFKQEDNGMSFAVAANTSLLNLGVLNPAIYRLNAISTHDIEEDTGSIVNAREFTELNKKEILQAERNPLTAPTTDRPVFVREGSNIIRVYPTFAEQATVSLYFWRKPVTPNWGYVVVSGEALYNVNTSVNFQLHPSEEEPLVTRILAIAGIAIKSMELAQAATVDEGNATKKQND